MAGLTFAPQAFNLSVLPRGEFSFLRLRCFWPHCHSLTRTLHRDGGYFPASRQASKWPGVGHQTCLKRLPDCSSSAPPQIGQVSPATNAEARVSKFSPNWFRPSFLSVAD